MPKFEQNAVKRNISMLMEKKHITQKELSEAIGMSQPNLSKNLNEKDKRFFTVEQICAVADYLNVSLNTLLQTPATKRCDTDMRSIGEFIIELLNNDKIELVRTSIRESITCITCDENTGYPSDTGGVYEGVIYNALVFPNHSNNFEREVLLSANNKAFINTTGNKPINDFLNKLPEIRDLYKRDMLPQEAYDTIIEKYLEQLSDNSYNADEDLDSPIPF